MEKKILPTLALQNSAIVESGLNQDTSIVQGTRVFLAMVNGKIQLQINVAIPVIRQRQLQNPRVASMEKTILPTLAIQNIAMVESGK